MQKLQFPDELMSGKPYVCIVQYEDGTRSIEQFDDIADAVELRRRMMTGLSAMTAVVILCRMHDRSS